jgi:pimeloyl-ACP methyl ester carboxylesterase
MQQIRSLEGLCHAAVIVMLLLTCSASSWSQTRLDSAPVGAQAAHEAARARVGPGQPAACRRDTTPHQVTFVEVEPGVKLAVLDWGGSGAVMVLLTGSGDNAHVFDDFAFQFTDFFHVIGITRRGWLPSSQPENGYDVETRAADDIKVLDALGIKKAVFVGHSISGAELSKIAVKYPSYVDKLVYLDASDLSERNTLTPDAIQAQLSAGVSIPANPPTTWVDIKVPRLGIFAPPTVESKLPFYWYLSPADQAVFDERFPRLLRWYSDVIDKFAEQHPESPPPEVHLLPGAPHYVYINNEAEVVRQMRNFLGIPVEGN